MAVAESTALAQPKGMAGVRHRNKELRLPWIPIIVLALLLFVAATADIISPHDPTENNVVDRLTPPFQDSKYLLGTDNLGADVLSRLLHGTRTILKVTVPAIVISVGVGTTIGLISGYAGKWVDSILMRLTDAVLGFPSILVALLIVALVGRGLGPVLAASSRLHGLDSPV